MSQIRRNLLSKCACASTSWIRHFDEAIHYTSFRCFNLYPFFFLVPVVLFSLWTFVFLTSTNSLARFPSYASGLSLGRNGGEYWKGLGSSAEPSYLKHTFICCISTVPYTSSSFPIRAVQYLKQALLSAIPFLNRKLTLTYSCFAYHWHSSKFYRWHWWWRESDTEILPTSVWTNKMDPKGPLNLIESITVPAFLGYATQFPCHSWTNETLNVQCHLPKHFRKSRVQCQQSSAHPNERRPLSSLTV